MSLQCRQIFSRIAVVSLIAALGTTVAAQSNTAKVGDTSLVGPYWKAIEIAGKPVPTQDAKREAHLILQPGNRVSGSDGCNQFTGTYELKGDAITFGQLASTQMACVSIGEIDRAFRDALENARKVTAAADRLQLSDANGARVAVFASRMQTVPTTAELAGTSWQLVKFQGGDGTMLTPDDRAKYTIDFAAGGQLTARIDCNRGRGTWKSSGPNQIQFGTPALTRAQCPPGSLHDQIVKQWGNVRSFVMKDGHLFLSLMADGGIYEFERLTKKP